MLVRQNEATTTGALLEELTLFLCFMSLPVVVIFALYTSSAHYGSGSNREMLGNQTARVFHSNAVWQDSGVTLARFAVKSDLLKSAAVVLDPRSSQQLPTAHQLEPSYEVLAYALRAIHAASRPHLMSL
jgi:hypothetical protein